MRVSFPPILETTTGATRASTDQGHNLLEHLLGWPAVAVRILRDVGRWRVLGGMIAHEGRESHGALRAAHREPVLRHPLRQLTVRDGGPEGGPGPRDDAPYVVAPAAGRDPAAAAELVGELVHPLRHVFVEAGRGREVRQGVEGVAVAAVLGEDEVGLEGAQHLGDDVLEARDPGLVVRVRLERNVDRVADASVAPPLVYSAGPGEAV